MGLIALWALLLRDVAGVLRMGCEKIIRCVNFIKKIVFTFLFFPDPFPYYFYIRVLQYQLPFFYVSSWDFLGIFSRPRSPRNFVYNFHSWNIGWISLLLAFFSNDTHQIVLFLFISKLHTSIYVKVKSTSFLIVLFLFIVLFSVNIIFLRPNYSLN